MFDKLGTNDPRVNGAFRFYMGVTSTLATIALGIGSCTATKTLEKIDKIEHTTTKIVVKQADQERRLTRTEDSIQDVLQRIARQEGGR